MPETAHKRQWTSTVYATPPMTPTTDLGLSIRLSMLELRETGDWDIFLVPPERASLRAETGGADQWVLKRRELPGFAIVNEKKRLHPHQFSIKTLLLKVKQKPRVLIWITTRNPSNEYVASDLLALYRRRFEPPLEVGCHGKLTLS